MAQSSTMELNPQLGGSLLLFDRRELRYFPNDGHNWKKKDGKTMKEAHKKFKVGGIDVLHCYYAHGEDDENFQRRSYRMLEEDLADIVLVHYREVKDGKVPNVLNNEGQGVLYLAAALGYDWAIKPIIAAGVGINFRDLHGWTALHWAACFGRGKTVVTLIALDTSPGALTDPTPEFPSGRTPAVFASQNGYKRIAGVLQMQTSLKESPSAFRNATDAAARIYQVFRAQSFHRKELIDCGNENCKISDEDALTLISVKSNKSGGMPVHAAAIKIQNKFRGWKGRKEFSSIRQQIIKILVGVDRLSCSSILLTEPSLIIFCVLVHVHARSTC